MIRIVAVVGNPKSPSRTLAATSCLLRLMEAADPELIDLGRPELQEGLAAARPGPALQRALSAVAGADAVVFASPTYKAAYTGLLKCFLDLLPQGALEGKLTLPVMLGASESHRLTVEHTLKPVLAELGGTFPPHGLYLVDASIQTDPPTLSSEQTAEVRRFLDSAPGTRQVPPRRIDRNAPAS